MVGRWKPPLPLSRSISIGIRPRSPGEPSAFGRDGRWRRNSDGSGRPVPSLRISSLQRRIGASRRRAAESHSAMWTRRSEIGRIVRLPPVVANWNDPAWQAVPAFRLPRNEPFHESPRYRTEIKWMHDGRTLASARAYGGTGPGRGAGRAAAIARLRATTTWRFTWQQAVPPFSRLQSTRLERFATRSGYGTAHLAIEDELERQDRNADEPRARVLDRKDQHPARRMRCRAG